MNGAPPLAHSASAIDREPHLYGDHVRDAFDRARANAEAVSAYIADPSLRAGFVAAVVDGIAFHDLGKLDSENQAALHEGRTGRMRWDHVDAGVAHLLSCGAKTAAWIVRAHHAPGLPAKAVEFNRLDPSARGLRGGRIGDIDMADALTARNNQARLGLVAAHAVAAGPHEPTRGGTKHGLFMRPALSCLVDADHTDAADYEKGWRVPDAPSPRWAERLDRLDAYVAGLPAGGVRHDDRQAFYKACREGPTDTSMITCEGPVGIGKTTAVAAWCLRRGMQSGARRIFVVAPYTTILSQTAKTLRQALILTDEAGREDEVIAEHHHRADFTALESRDLAVLWRAPIVVTTGVQFFETLAACEPARLRKLHGLPGAVVFLDEAHAALPAPLWRQNWSWMRELAQDWGCSFVFASGSLARVWEERDIVGETAVTRLPDIAPPALAARLNKAEHARVGYRTLGRVQDATHAILERTGPRLAVLNTVQTAAVVADRLRQAGADVLHVSTALCPSDRDRILEKVKQRLDPERSYGRDWTLVATSLIEAGVDLSFRTAFRERFSTASLIQVGGRANRHGGNEPGEVIDFQLDADDAMKIYRGAARSASVLGRLFDGGAFDQVFDPALLVTSALREEVRDSHGGTGDRLALAEAARDYPETAALGRLIDADTALVVVDQTLKRWLADGDKVSTRQLLAGSTQLWTRRIGALGVSPLPGRPGVHVWPHRYEPDFLGYMAGVLAVRSGAAFVI